MLSSVLTITAALQGRTGKHGALSDIPNEKPDQNASGLHSDAGRLEEQITREREDQETVAEQPSVVIPKRASDDDQLNEDARHTVQPGGSGGECWRLGNISSVKTCHLQSLRESGRTRHSGLLPFPLASQRSSKMGSVLSKLSSRTSSPFILIIKCAYLIASIRNSSLTNPYIGNLRQQQDRRPPRTHNHTRIAFRNASW